MKKFFCGKFFAVVCVILLCFVVSPSEADDDETRIAVLTFQSSTVDAGPNHALIIGDVFSQRLSVSDKLVVIGHGEIDAIVEGEKIPTSGYISNKNAAQIGKLAECKYVILGTVTNLKMKSSSTGIAFIGAFGSRKEEATAAADVKLIDVETAETVATFSETSNASQSGSYVGIAGVSTSQSDLNGMQQAAISNLAMKLSMRVRDAIGDPITVNTASAKEVTLGIGSEGGASKGDLFRIYTGSGNREQTIAVVKASNVQLEKTTAAIADKSSGNLSLVRKGDKVTATDSVELKALQKGKKFVKSRPREKSDSGEDVLDSSSSKKTTRKTKRAKQ